MRGRVLLQGMDSMKLAAVIAAYALLILIGGGIGYWKAGSMGSLIMGITCGSALLLSAFYLAKGRTQILYFVLFLTFCLDAFFTYRFAKTLHFVPAGLMSLLSLVVLIVIAMHMRASAKKHS